MTASIKGLNTFITDIRHCSTKDKEQERCEKEMAKIRNKFASNKGLSGYQKKKYVWKLLYMYILGYDIDFGYYEAANLINCAKFSEKYTGYIATGILVNENNTDLYKTITMSIQADLMSNNEINQSLALSMIGSLAPQELVESLHEDVAKIALSENTKFSLFVRKKALLCLLRIFRKYRDKFDPNTWVAQTLAVFNQKYLSLGFLNAACSFLLAIVGYFPPSTHEELIGRIVKLLQKLIINRDCSQDYLYYSTPNPWLQVKLLKILQELPPPSDPTNMQILLEILNKVIKKTEVTKTVNKNNADHGILFEAANLIITYRNAIPNDLSKETITLLGVFITVREPNLRYLALESMCRFAATPTSTRIISEHLNTILQSLRDPDISIRRRALDILYLMCSTQTAGKVIEDLLSYVDESDLLFREELVLKIAILAEKFADDLMWYIDVVIRLVSQSGEYVTDDIWYRIVQIITGFGVEASPELQKYACLKLYNALNVPHVHETLVKIGSFIISEYAEFLIDAGKDPKKIFDTLNRHFGDCSEKGKAILLSGYVKLANKFEDLVDEIQAVFQLQGEHFDPDIQQRAIEYLQISLESQEIRSQILAKTPPFSEEIQNNNPLLKRIYHLKLSGVEKMKDQTLLNQSKKIAEETVDRLQKSLKPQSFEDSTLSSLTDDDYLQSLTLHPLYPHITSSRLSSRSSLLPPPKPSSLVPNVSNLNELKELFPTGSGLILTSADLQIQYKSMFNGFTGQIAMQFEGKRGALSNLQVLVGNANGMTFNIAPVKYEQFPQVLMQVIATDPALGGIPVATVFYNMEGTAAQQRLEFALPIWTAKFVTPIEMPQENYEKFYEEYTRSGNPNYHRLDYYLKNPAPANVSIGDVLRKLGGLLNSLNIKAYPYPDMQNLTMLKGAGQFCFRGEGGAPVNLPLIVEIEGSDELKSHLRLSIRGGGSPATVKGIWQNLMIFLDF